MDLLSRNVHVNVPAPKAVSSLSAIDRWSDYIGRLVGDSHHLGTLSTVLQHFTHNEIQWPTAAHRCRFVLRDVSCRQSWHLSTPSHPRGSPRVTIMLASPVRTLVHCVVKHSRPPDLKSSSNISLPFAWITGTRKRTQLMGCDITERA
jgi:hypothetical protein